MTAKHCGICNRELDVPGEPLSLDCGGDCVQCMAEAGDPDCAEEVKRVNVGVDKQPKPA